MSQAYVNRFNDLREKSVQQLLDKRGELQVVGTYCTFAPQELILAAGAIPVSLCGTREEPISAAEETLPRNLCPLIKSSYGFGVTDKCPFFYFADLIVGETTCDGKKKMFELMKDFKPVHVMQLPSRPRSPEALELWTNEMRLLKERLEKQMQVVITDEQLWQAIDLIEEERASIKALHDLNQQEPPLLTGMQLLTATWSRGFALDKQEAIKMTRELKERAESSVPETKPGRARILLTGVPVGLGSEKVIRLVEELGAYVVALENCTGYKTLNLKPDRSLNDPLALLAEMYLKIPCSCMSPNSGRMELLDRMMTDFKVDAVIDLTWQACHTYNIESRVVEKLVKARNLPFLHLESDYSSSDLETLRVRIEALLEMTGK